MPVRAKNKWIPSEKGAAFSTRTDILEADVKDIVHYHALVVLEVATRPTFDPRTKETRQNRTYRFTKCTPNGALKGYVHEGELTYDALLQMLG